MSDVREVIEARLAEIEAAALTVTTPHPIAADFAPMRVMVGPHDEPGSHDGPVVGLAADPAAVLAWVAGIRAVVALHHESAGECDICLEFVSLHDEDYAMERYPCPTLLAIAGIWGIQ